MFEERFLCRRGFLPQGRDVRDLRFQPAEGIEQAAVRAADKEKAELARGAGRSKKDAEQLAARIALEGLT